LFVLPVGFLFFLRRFILKKQVNKIFMEKRDDLVKVLGFGLASLIISGRISRINL